MAIFKAFTVVNVFLKERFILGKWFLVHGHFSSLDYVQVDFPYFKNK